MTRQKPADKKQKPGRKSNFSTCKENIICDNFGETYLAAHATSKPEVGLFLNKVANWAIHRWGYSKSLHVDTDGEDDDPTEVFSLDVDLPDDDISEEEATERTAYYDDIRNKLGALFRRKLLHAPITASDVQPSTGASVLALVAAKVPKKPTRSNYLNQYMKIYYQTLMKGEADNRLAAATAEYEKLTDEEKDTKGPPSALAIRKNVARDFWATESAEVKAAVLQAAGTEHEEDLAEYLALKEVPKTPAQHYHQIRYAGVTLKPIADSIARQMGCPVIIMLPLIMPHRRGTVELLSVHGTKPGNLASETFFKTDPVGYAAAEASVAKFGYGQYTAEERAQRTFAPSECPAPERIEGVESTLFDDTTPETPIGTTVPGTSTVAELPVSVQQAASPSTPSSTTPPPRLSPSPSLPSPYRLVSLSPQRCSPTPLPRPLPPLQPRRPSPTPAPRPLPTPAPAPPPAPAPAPPPVPPAPAPAPPPAPPLAPAPATPAPALALLASATPAPALALSAPPAPPPAPAPPAPASSIVITARPRPTPSYITWPTGTPAIQGPTLAPRLEPTPAPALALPAPAPAPAPPAPAPAPTAPAPAPAPPAPPPAPAPPAPAPSIVITARPRPTPSYITWPTGAPAIQGPTLAPRLEPFPARRIADQAGKELLASSPTPSPSRLPPHIPSASHLGFIDLPDYMQEIYDYLLKQPSDGTSRELGVQWLLCVREYVGFEKKSGFVDNGEKLADAPEIVQYWRKSHRPWKDQQPRLQTLEAMIAEWWAWWLMLQPMERVVDGNGKCAKPSPAMDWSSLAKVGSNGFLLIMLSLTWWGQLQPDNEWYRAIKDVTSVLRSLPQSSTASPSPSNKRKAPLSQSDGHSLNTPRPIKRRKSAAPVSKPVSPRRLRARK